MKLLLDENLSPRLIDRLVQLYPNIAHVRDAGLKQADDRTIWNWAKDNCHSIVTTDADFIELSQRLGSPPPKVIFIERCNFTFRVIEELLRRNAVRITEFEKEEAASLFILRFPQGGLR